MIGITSVFADQRRPSGVKKLFGTRLLALIVILIPSSVAGPVMSLATEPVAEIELITGS